MGTKRDLVAEIQARRARGEPYPSIAPFRLDKLRRALPTAQPEQELLRYFPIAVVAIAEGFFRKAIGELLDADPARLGRVLDSPFGREQKFDLSILGAVAGKSVTVGDLVAHLLPFKGVDHIEAHMSLVIGSSFFGQLRIVHDRVAVELEGKPKAPIIKDLDQVLAHLAKAFEYRHIFAHELAESHVIAPAEVAGILDSASVFLSASAEVVGNTLQPNYPLTQADMNTRAAAGFRDADRALTRRLKQFSKTLRPNQKRALDRAQKVWVKFREAHAAFVRLEAEGGSMAPLLVAGALEEVTRERIDHLESHFREDQGTA